MPKREAGNAWENINMLRYNTILPEELILGKPFISYVENFPVPKCRHWNAVLIQFCHHCGHPLGFSEWMWECVILWQVSSQEMLQGGNWMHLHLLYLSFNQMMMMLRPHPCSGCLFLPFLTSFPSLGHPLVSHLTKSSDEELNTGVVGEISLHTLGCCRISFLVR